MDIRTVIRRLLSGQKLGVLATRETRSPYQNLVAFAVSGDLRHIYFATAAETRKHANLIRFPRVSMLFDNRSNAAADFYQGIDVACNLIHSMGAGADFENLEMTPVPFPIAKALIQGLKSETTIQNDNAQRYFPRIRPLSYEESFRRALNKIERTQAISRWFDSSAQRTYDIEGQDRPEATV